MADDQIRAGKIMKVVHVRFGARAGGDETNLGGSHGYGILKDVDGCDVFFIDSALQDAQFTELHTGQDVYYIIENGPLGRAAKVWVAPPPPVICSREKERLIGDGTGRNGDAHQPATEFTGEVLKACVSRGRLIIGAGIYGNVIRFLAPLVITD